MVCMSLFYHKFTAAPLLSARCRRVCFPGPASRYQLFLLATYLAWCYHQAHEIPMGQTPDSRLRIRILLIGVILATLPCYCTGYVAARLAQVQASLPTATITPLPSMTFPVAASPVQYPTATPEPQLPSATPTWTATPSPFPTRTAIPTLTFTLQPSATSTLPPSPTPTFTWTPPPPSATPLPPTPTSEPVILPSATSGDTG